MKRFLLGAVLLAACDYEHRRVDSTCNCTVTVPSVGEATLQPHVSAETWSRAVVSFEWATTTDSAEVRNDWDLVVQNSPLVRGEQVFRVNTVVDDVSCIEDLGAIEIAKVPTHLSTCNELVPVVEGHVYLVHTVDADTDQYAAFGVTEYVPDAHTSLRWFRSAAADHFALSP